MTTETRIWKFNKIKMNMFKLELSSPFLLTLSRTFASVLIICDFSASFGAVTWQEYFQLVLLTPAGRRFFSSVQITKKKRKEKKCLIKSQPGDAKGKALMFTCRWGSITGSCTSAPSNTPDDVSRQEASEGSWVFFICHE